MNVIREGDSLRVPVQVEDTGGFPVNLGAATIAVKARKGAQRRDATVTLLDALNGRFDFFFDPGELTLGRWYIQATVTLSGETSTVYTSHADVRRGV